MNILQDGYPTDYKGYLIRCSFLNAMQIIDCLNDDDFTDAEKQGQALNLLYGNGVPEDLEVAFDGLSWFLNCGMEVKGESNNTVQQYDFKIDGGRIASAFKRFYNIDITKEDMHWFDFCDKMSDFGECAFTNVIDIRTKDINDGSVPEKMKETYRKLKERYALYEDEDALMSDFEKEQIKAFLELVKNN
jgi:hypothetical protein